MTPRGMRRLQAELLRRAETPDERRVREVEMDREAFAAAQGHALRQGSALPVLSGPPRVYAVPEAAPPAPALARKSLKQLGQELRELNEASAQFAEMFGWETPKHGAELVASLDGELDRLRALAAEMEAQIAGGVHRPGLAPPFPLPPAPPPPPPVLSAAERLLLNVDKIDAARASAPSVEPEVARLLEELAAVKAKCPPGK